MTNNCNGNGWLDDDAGGNSSRCPGCDACHSKSDNVIHKDRPDLALDAVEVAIFGVDTNVFTLILSGAQKIAWIEIVGQERIQIAFPIIAVAHLILGYVASEREHQKQAIGNIKELS